MDPAYPLRSLPENKYYKQDCRAVGENRGQVTKSENKQTECFPLSKMDIEL